MTLINQPAGRTMIGVSPRADLLPPEIKANEKARAQRRLLGGIVVLMLVLVGISYALVTLAAVATEARLAEANARTQDLLAQQGQYVEVRQLATQVETAEAAQMLGVSTEIDLTEYLTLLQGTLPVGASFNSVGFTGGSPLGAYPGTSEPLLKPRVAELVFSVKTAVLPDVADWLDRLVKLPGAVDATPGTITLGDDGIYTVGVTMHVDERAFSNRFIGEDGAYDDGTTDDAESADEETESTEDEPESTDEGTEVGE